MTDRRDVQNPFDNQEFRQELEQVLDTKLAPVHALRGDLTTLEGKVEDHSTTLNYMKGAGGLLALLAGAAEWFFHRA